MADALSQRYVFISTITAKFMGFEHIEELYLEDLDFSAIFYACEVKPFDKFYQQDGYLFSENKLCIPKWSLHELLSQESIGGGLMGHLGILKTLRILKEHFL